MEKDEQLIFNACQTLLMTIGEETKKIDASIKEQHAKIPWKLITQLRNRIAHDYRSINPTISYDVVKNYLPPLKKELIEIVKRIEYPEEKLQKVLASPYYAHLGYLKTNK